MTIEVTDDGPGIPDHVLATLETGDETALEHGSGLGLWIVTWGVAALGGRVDFAVDHAGSTVRVVLPAAEPEEDDGEGGESGEA